MTAPSRIHSVVDMTNSEQFFPRAATGQRRHRAIRGVVASLTVLAVVTGVAACEAGDNQSGTTGPTVHRSDLDSFYRQQVAWHACAQDAADSIGQALDTAGAECAEVRVPLDYGDPQGRQITVAMSRLQAADAADRIGVLLVNNGGPGLPAVESPPQVREAMGTTGERFDIIGFDPRFVGRSTPLDCGWPTGAAIYSAGTTRDSFEAQVAFQKDLADRCAATNASVLPYITTRNTARDMDVVRGALGEERISYLGYSYGTYLGTVYTQLFPDRTDRMVLDGAIAPDDYNSQLLKGLDDINEQALADWAEWTAVQQSTYQLGATGPEVLATVRGIIEDAGRAPLRVGPVALDDTQIPLLIFQGLPDDTDAARAALAEKVALLAEAADGKTVRPSEGFAALLTAVFTDVDTNLGTAQAAIGCGDVAAARDPEAYWHDIEASSAKNPVFGPLADNISLCAFWAPPREELTQVSIDAAPLIVAATGDPRTTYASSQKLHRELPSSRLLTLDGAKRHGLYGQYGNRCVDLAVTDYLDTGHLPAHDPSCTL